VVITPHRRCLDSAARSSFNHRAFNARVDELFALIAPDDDEYAAILRRARDIGQAMERRDWAVEACREATLRNARLLLAIAGCLGWLEFVLTQVAEYWQWLPWIGWGLAHGLDALCAVGGTALLLIAWFLDLRRIRWEGEHSITEANWPDRGQ
jgi:hypothetical protein